MARQPRIDLPGIPRHVVQRGNDRHACFADERDYRSYLIELHDAAHKHDCAVHAYVLMTNHVHLLVTPSRQGTLSRMMQAIGRRYVGCFNARYRRTGTLWEGRYKAALVDSERYVMGCYRYIELNPVRARMVPTPTDYRWSSHAHNAHGEHSAMLTPHASYLKLGSTPQNKGSGSFYMDPVYQPPGFTSLVSTRLSEPCAASPDRTAPPPLPCTAPPRTHDSRRGCRCRPVA